MKVKESRFFFPQPRARTQTPLPLHTLSLPHTPRPSNVICGEEQLCQLHYFASVQNPSINSCSNVLIVSCFAHPFPIIEAFRGIMQAVIENPLFFPPPTNLGCGYCCFRVLC